MIFSTCGYGVYVRRSYIVTSKYQKSDYFVVHILEGFDHGQVELIIIQPHQDSAYGSIVCHGFSMWH